MASYELTVLVLTEDSAEAATETVKALARRMLQLIEPSCQTHRIGWEPANETVRPILRANRWKEFNKNTKLGRAYTDLLRTIASKIVEASPSGFVLFHFDGDRTWSARKTSENAAAFDKLIRDRVRAVLVANGVTDVDQTLTRLVAVAPHYSIEAWLYQSTRRAMDLCREYYANRDVNLFERWRDEPSLLDEVHKPKDAICLASRHNLDLARALTQERSNDIYDVGKSFAAVVDALLECLGIREALRSTTVSSS